MFENYFKDSTEIDFDLLQPTFSGYYEHYKVQRKPYCSFTKKHREKVKVLNEDKIMSKEALPELEEVKEDSNNDAPNKKMKT